MANFVASLERHGVHSVYSEEVDAYICKNRDSWKADGQDCYVKGSTKYPLEYSHATDQVFMHLRSHCQLGTGSSGNPVTKSFAYPTGEVLAHKTHYNNTEVAHCHRFAGNPRVIQIRHIGRKGILYEFMNENNLAVLIHSGKLTTSQKASIVQQLILAVHTVHQAGLVHRDIRPRNFLVNRNPDETLTVKITGLDLATDAERPAHWQGYVPYQSPDRVKNLVQQRLGSQDNSLPAFKEDHWSLGVTIYELVHGKRPEFCKTVQDLISQNPPREDVTESLDRQITQFCEALVPNSLDDIVRKLLTGKVESLPDLLHSPLLLGN